MFMFKVRNSIPSVALKEMPPAVISVHFVILQNEQKVCLTIASNKRFFLYYLLLLIIAKN
jgi:hypothetical protein